MRLRIVAAMVAAAFCSVGCVAGPARTAGKEAAGGFFEGAEAWWETQKPLVLAEAKEAAGTLAAKARDEAVRVATDTISPRIDAVAATTGAGIREKIDSVIEAKLGPVGAGLTNAALAAVDGKVEAKMAEVRTRLIAAGSSPAALDTPGGIASELARRAAGGDGSSWQDYLLLFGLSLLGYVTGSGIKGGVRAAVGAKPVAAPDVAKLGEAVERLARRVEGGGSA